MLPNSLENIFGHSILANAFHSAVRIGLYNCLQAEFKSLKDLARILNISERAACVLLDAQVAIGLVMKQGNTYSATAETLAFLHPEGEGYCMPIYWDWFEALWDMENAIRMDSPVIDVSSAMYHDRWAYYARKSFVTWRDESRYAIAVWSQIIESGLISADCSVAYVACGAGVFALSLAQLNPRCDVILLDSPKVLEVAEKIAVVMGVANRTIIHPYNFLEAKKEHPSKRTVDYLIFHYALQYVPVEALASVIKNAVSEFNNVKGIIVIGREVDDNDCGSRTWYINNIYMSTVSPQWAGHTPSIIKEAMTQSGFNQFNKVSDSLLICFKKPLSLNECS